mgnify:CR=1 FL=1
MPKDYTQRRNERWETVFPGIGLESILGRILRIARYHNHKSTETMKPFGIKKGDSLSKKRHALNVDNTRARDDPQRAGQRLAGLVWHLPRSEIGGRHLALMARPVRVYVFLPVFRAGKHSGKLG